MEGDFVTERKNQLRTDWISIITIYYIVSTPISMTIYCTVFL